MLIDRSFSEALVLLFLLALIIALSIVIPFYAYNRKRWKGLALGCIIQPVVCVITICLLFAGTMAYEVVNLMLERKAAMVAVRTIEPGSFGPDTITWYLKPDDECFVECERNENPYKDDAGEIHRRFDRFDIISHDSVRLCVEDRIVVRFELNNQKVYAANYGEPIEVVSVKWDKVKTYFGK